jgi:hypothetical protein
MMVSTTLPERFHARLLNHTVESALQSIIPGRPPTRKVLDPVNLQFLKVKLRECDQQHPDCWLGNRRYADKPRRLVHLDRQDNKLVARLVNARFIVEPFAALSYVWGDSSAMIRTLTTNKDRFYKNIPLSKVQNRLVEAFALVKNLGLNYIWLDAL